MSEELVLVEQLALILIAAGIFTVISKALRQPLILGYIVAGFIVGPGLGLFPQFSPESVHQWSELGIIFMLFGLGLEFNFKKLLEVGSAAVLTAGTICVGMLVVGISAGTLMGWSALESIFLGGLLTMSSTTVILKAYEDLGLKSKPYAPLIFGSLVVEDLIAVLLMVLLSTLAMSNKFAGTQMLLALCKLLFFLMLCFLIGMYVVPTLLRWARKYLTDEILLLCGIGLCFLLVVLANMAGFSSALGAFLMGSVLASTVEGERVAKVTTGVKDLFGAVFFVSVGMMLDPSVIAGHWGTILIITALAMCGILLFSTAGVLLSGGNLDSAVHIGFSLAQLGEFGFIIAGLGCSLGVVRDFIYPVVIASSVLTTFTTPYMIKAGDPALRWIRAHFGPRFLKKFDRPYEEPEEESKAEQNEWKVFLKRYCLRVVVYSVLLAAVLLGAKEFLPKLSALLLPDASDTAKSAVETAVTLLVMCPFIFGLAVNGDSLKGSAGILLRKDPRARVPIIASIFFRIFVAAAFVVSVVAMHFKLGGWVALLVFALVAVLFLARGSDRRLSYVEDRFLGNLNAREAHQASLTPISTTLRRNFAGNDVKTFTVSVPQNFVYAGKSLREMPFRHSCGVNIVKIQRGAQSILIPSGDVLVLPFDQLVAVGTSSQLKSFKETMDASAQEVAPSGDEEFTVERIVLEENSPLCGKMLRETDMRSVGCMVVSVERAGEQTTNPGSDFVFAPSDAVWLAGRKDSIEWYK